MTTAASSSGIEFEYDTLGSADHTSLLPAHHRIAAANDAAVAS